MENKGFKFFKKGSAFLIAPALSSSFLPGMSANTVGGNVASKAASKSAISKFGAGTVKFLGNHWVLALLVGAGLFAWWLWPSDESEGTSELGEKINDSNSQNEKNIKKDTIIDSAFNENDGIGGQKIKNDFNVNDDTSEKNVNNVNNVNDINDVVNDNSINNDFKVNNNNDKDVVDQNLRNLYRQKLDEYKKTLTVDSVNRQIKKSSGTFFSYEWVFVKNCYLIKLSEFRANGNPGDGLPIYIFPTNDGRVFGFCDASDKKDLSFMLPPCDLNNFVELNDLWRQAFDGQLFSAERVQNCSDKKILFEEFGVSKELDSVSEEQVAFFELIRDNDPNFWNMRNNPGAIEQDIQLQQQKKMNNNGMMMGNNNNQNFGNPQGMNDGFQGNNNGFPQQMGMNNP